ncbi:MAG TPA: cytochrome P460 family protein [Bryobacteraceae bacterium]|nr:cytochrome P460 family protein [Bryobacteraceae bacterium]
MKRFFTLSMTVLALFLSTGTLLLKAQTPELPAPTVDRIGFPLGYQNSYVKVYTFDNYQNRQIRVVWANPTAASVTPDTVHKFPFGSIIVMETYAVQEDANGEPVLDGKGRFIPAQNAVPTVFVQRKEKGFGVDYGVIRNGDWEYVAYHPDGSYATAPSGTGSCAACHLTGASGTTAAPAGVPVSANSINIGEQWDYVFRPELFATPAFGGGSGAVPAGVLQHYVFVPTTIHAQPGQVVTVYNSDQILHHIVADDASFDTGVMNPGASFSVTAGSAGTVISYHCTLHSRMKGKIVVDPPSQQ